MKEKEEKSELLKFAMDVAEKAGRNIMRYHGPQLERDYTDKTHFKTLVDDMNDKMAREMIAKRFPSHGILSEESAPHKGESDLTWVIDGIDGTINFSTGYTDHFSFCLGLCLGETPIMGVINAPKRNEFYTAEVGKGAFCNGKRIQVSNLADIHKVLMGSDAGKFNRTANLPYLAKLHSPEGVTCACLNFCASVPLCLVASGVIHAYLATSLNPEDMAAAVIIIREAGGKVTNLKNKEWQLGDESILAANPVLHQKLVDFLEIGKNPKEKSIERPASAARVVG